MTKPSISLTELTEKGSDVDVLRQMIQYVSQRLMDMDVEGRCSAGLWRTEPGPGQQSERVSRTDLGHSKRHGRSSDSQAPTGQLLSRIPGTSADRRESSGRSDSGSLHPGCLHTIGRRTGAVDGDDRHLEEPGVPAVRRDR